MSGKNGGVPQVYNIIDGHNCHSSSGEWFHILKAGSDKNILCAAPQSTVDDVDKAVGAAKRDAKQWQAV